MTADENAIRQLIATWVDGMTRGEVEKILPLMDDNAVFLTAGQRPMHGRKAFSAAHVGFRNCSIDACSDVEEVCVMGEWAYAWTTLTVIMERHNAEPSRRSGNTLSIFRRRPDGTWVLWRDANMLTLVS